jgi:hypothetical protein
VLKTISAMALVVALHGSAHAWTYTNNGMMGGNAAASASAKARATALSSSYARGGNARAYGGTGIGYGGAGGHGGNANSTNTNVINAGNGGGGGNGWGGVMAYAPSGNNTAECQKSWSFGIAGGPGGLSFGIPTDSEDCQRRHDISVLWAMGRRERYVARKLLCQSSRVAQAYANAGLSTCRGVATR